MHVEKQQDLNLNKNLLDKANKNTKGKKIAHLLTFSRKCQSEKNALKIPILYTI